jgi:hypothetical protein
VIVSRNYAGTVQFLVAFISVLCAEMRLNFLELLWGLSGFACKYPTLHFLR